MIGYALTLIALAVAFAALTLSHRYTRNRNSAAHDMTAAVLNADELEKHAADVALSHAVSPTMKPSYKLLGRMEDNYGVIIRTYREMSRDVENGKAFIPAAEWLFDNFYAIDEQVREIRLIFPRGYYGVLPALTGGILEGFPRVYAIALELVSHTDGKIDERTLVNFIGSYQTNAQLTSGELWAIPLILRIALIENIRVLCSSLSESRRERERAEEAGGLLKWQDGAPDREGLDRLESSLEEMAPLSPPFVEHLLDSLRKRGIDSGCVLRFIDEKLVSNGMTVEDMVKLEHREEAAAQVSMGNSVTSLKFVGSLDWENIFETLSPVEEVLRGDPSGVYPKMDFCSRDHYRHVIETIARRLRVSESSVARKAIECCRAPGGGSAVESHVGYYIIGNGAEEFERSLRYKPGLGARLVRSMKRHPLASYALPVAVLTAAFTSALAAYSYASGVGAFLPALTCILVLLPASELSVGIINWAVTHMLKPSLIPKMDLKDGIPEESFSAVVIPALLPSADRAKSLLEQLEVYYLANPEHNLCFCLLGDFTDSKSESMPDDSLITAAALAGVRNLNKKYAHGKDIFYFFHRSRKFNPCQQSWMGWERKRGKLLEFNRLLRGDDSTSYYVMSGSISQLPPIKYVITLDADTELPRGAARKLIGAISHPLNRALVGPRRITEGYGVLQPRVSIGVLNANRSAFSRIFAGSGGIDPYTTAVSDVYQDLFGEGIYTGKGIYEVDAFESVLDGALPQNRILSHDLLEGSYARTGLVTDIELVDGFPWKYSSYSARLHRWVRGDWQLIGWLSGRVSTESSGAVRNPLSGRDRWKIFDNIRRSLIAPSLLLLIFFGCFLLPGSVFIWQGIVLLTIALPVVADMVEALFKNGNRHRGGILHASEITGTLLRIALLFIFIPHRAHLMADAASRTLFRLLISHRNLLEWETASDAEARLRNDLLGNYANMWSCPGCAAVMAALLILRPSHVWLGAIYALLWSASPYISYLISTPTESATPSLADRDVEELRRVARKTWAYFEDLVSSGDNFLPPDNFQEDPYKGAAHRTSSTNIGLYMASVLSARDMGFICTTDMVDRLENTFSTIDRLDKWKGHLYNWYDTLTLKPLTPLYVSTVDSGNFIGYLISLKEGIEEYIDRPLIGRNLLSGLADTIELVNEDLDDQNRIDTKFLRVRSGDLQMDCLHWNNIMSQMRAVISALEKRKLKNTSWLRRLENMTSSIVDESDRFFGWTGIAADIPRQLQFGGGDGSPLNLGRIFHRLNAALSLSELSAAYGECIDDVLALSQQPACREFLPWLRDFASTLKRSYGNVNDYISRSTDIIERCENMVSSTDFHRLYDEKRGLFSIGYSVEEGQPGGTYYDLLASEERQTSFISIAKGDVDQRHWFRLGRPLAAAYGLRGLVSWSGTMFEYLMPLLIMRDYPNTLLHETYEFVLKSQIEYGRMRRTPWGVSESGYNAFDLNMNYQYRAFGVPGLGLKRGLARDVVIAPYAAVLGLLVDPVRAMENIREMEKENLEGEFGLYEAIDYTPERVPRGKRSAVIKSYMAHHHGMSLLSIDNVINSFPMQERFHRSPIVKSAELLLQEKVPERGVIGSAAGDELSPCRGIERDHEIRPRVVKATAPDFPEAGIISNGSYITVLTGDGLGYSTYNDIAVSRWRGGWRGNIYGIFFYIRNVNSNMTWSSSYEPCRVEPDDYSVFFSEDRVEYHRVDGSIDTRTEVIVSPEDSCEMRRISLTNRSKHSRVIEVTSYLEVVISPQSDDETHPAFNNLFVMTEFSPEADTLLAVRRPRNSKNHRLWMFHAVNVEGETIGSVQYETDRMKFLGRNRDVSDPAAMEIDRPLSGTLGAVTDPVMSIRKRVRIEPGETAKVLYITGVGASREEALTLSAKYRDASLANRECELAWTRSKLEQRYLNLSEREIWLYQRLISHLIYISPLRSRIAERIRENNKGQSGLWPYGISGDLPIVLLTIKKSAEADTVREALKMHEYWRMKGLRADLVIMNEHSGSYTQPLQEMLTSMISSSHAFDIRDQHGGVFLLQRDSMPHDDANLIFAAADILLRCSDGPIEAQVKYAPERKSAEIRHYDEMIKYKGGIPERTDLIYYNGLGGFAPDGGEYVITLGEGMHTPAPWSNVVSNGEFGFLVTESGGGYTWSENSRENKLTPWCNDPVSDNPGEIIYLRDEYDGSVWTPTPHQGREGIRYTIRHGFGYTVFESDSHGIAQHLTVFTPLHDRIKIYMLKLSNRCANSRELGAIFLIMPVLGVEPEKTNRFIVTENDRNSGVLLIRNMFSDDFPGRSAYIDCSESKRYVTGDRYEFPDVLYGGNLSGRVGAGFNPCASMQTEITLGRGEERTLIFTLGEERSGHAAIAKAVEHRDVKRAESELAAVKQYWTDMLCALKVNTPDGPLNMIVNGWLLYQTIACRMMARSAFYQSGGAYGFRDQLQDSLAAMYASPKFARDQILRSAARQYTEGDVQHWWHSNTNKGIRTRFSDDLLWLPYAVCRYVKITGDYRILDERAPYLEDKPLGDGEYERYGEAKISSEPGSIYEHCVRAVERSLRFGRHGIPLIGSGDWNDGMNNVGSEGMGESIWLGWFLNLVLKEFSQISAARADLNIAERYRNLASSIAESIESFGWDGSWYRRAFFDDGSLLGSAADTECQIDSIAQTWSAISGAGKISRVTEAMGALRQYLVRKEEGIVMLLTPPFDSSSLEPGYIKAYAPGIRENGGQYTHAAVWVVLAYTMLGDGDSASQIFNMINPLSHVSTPMECTRYKVEPYVMAADVYSAEPNVGRGGWTWYTGAAGWMYRVCVENMLGFKLTGNRLTIEPCIPKRWERYSLRYRFGGSVYRIAVKNPNGVSTGVDTVYLDGSLVRDSGITLVDDGKEHSVDVTMGK